MTVVFRFSSSLSAEEISRQNLHARAPRLRPSFAAPGAKDKCPMGRISPLAQLNVPPPPSYMHAASGARTVAPFTKV